MARLTPWALVLAGIALMYARRPEYFSAPGFWAEEGRVYFAGAWAAPWPSALVATPHGYLLLYTNVAAVLAANLVPLRHAPLVTTLCGLAVQTIPLLLIAFGRAPEWQGAVRKSVGVAIVLFASLTGEIWLNTINSQSHFALIAVLLLLEPSAVGRVRGGVYCALLALAGLTGPVACFLTPLYAVRAWRARDRVAIAQAVVITACAVVQCTALLAGGGELNLETRRAGLGIATVAFLVWMKTLVLPVAGVEAAHRFVGWVAGVTGRDLESPAARDLAVGLLVLAAGALAALAWRLTPRQRLVLVGGYVLVTGLTIVSAVGDRRMFLGHADNSSRYFYVPGALVLMLLMENVQRRPRRPPPLASVVCAALLALGLGLGAARYRESLRWRPDWPRWSAEVRAWEQDPAHALRIWPPPRWTLSLPPRPA